MTWAWKPTVTALAAGALGLAVAACGASALGAGEPTPDAGGGTIPTTTVAATPPDPTVTTPDGAPKVVQWAASKRYWCLAVHPGEAQTTVGWSAPSATSAEVLLDGRVLRTGLGHRPPYALLAPGPTGIGATIVFPCADGRSHRVTVRWRKDASPVVTKTVRIERAR
jgi:hypothetical protein